MFIKSGISIETKTYAWRPVNKKAMINFLTECPSSDGAFGLELVCEKDRVSTYFFYNEYVKHELLNSSVFKPVFRMVNPICFYVVPARSQCFPFNFEYNQNIFDQLTTALSRILTKETVFIQVILQKKKDDKWKSELSQQYKDYLDGIELPTSNPIIRSIQYKILDFIKTKDEWLGENPKIPYATTKYQEDGFDVLIRIVISGGDKHATKIIKRIKAVWSNLDYANQWILRRALNVEQFIKNIQLRRFSLLRNKMVLCTSELLPFFVDYGANELHHVEEPVNNEQELIHEESRTHYTIADYFPKRKHVPLDDEDNTVFAQKFNQALRKINLIQPKRDIIIQSINRSAAVKKVVFTLPIGLKLSDLQSATKDIQTELALENITFVQGDEAGTCSMIIPNKVRDVVYLGECIGNAEFQDFAKKSNLPFIIGTDINGRLIMDDLARIKNLLIAGSTGSGKSVFLNCMLVTLLTHCSPEDMQMVLIDPKQVELNGYRDYPHVISLKTNMDEVPALLSGLVNKMEERYTLFKNKGYKNLKQYNKNERSKLPYIVVVIEELADLIMTHPMVEEFIIRIAQKARAAGFHMIIATQRPEKEIVTGLIKSNIYSRICFLCDSVYSYRIALDNKPPFDLLGKGDGIYRLEGIQDMHRFQSPIISLDEDEADETIEKLSGYWKMDFKKESINPIKQETDLERLKKIIAETGETRLGELREMMGMKMNTVRELMQELVKEEWLSAPKTRQKGYELRLTEEQRKEYLETVK